jgi:hypothetical protein
VVVPVLDVERYRVRLEGAPIIPGEVFFEPPPAGTRLTRDLSTDIGVNLWFRVTDEEDRVIPEAVVRVQFQDPADPDHWNFVERSAFENGQINVWSVPPGTVMFEASAPGYVTLRSGLEATATYEHGYCPLVLRKAASVHGQCLHMGKPVQDFEVITWQTSDRASAASTVFLDREDGSFELDRVPVGDSWITACSGRLPGCEPVQIHATEEAITEVVLELPVAVTGAGMIVDQDSDEPIPDAEVQLFVPGDVVPIARWGDPVPAGMDGAFEVSGFYPGENHLRVMAPGYSRKVVRKVAAAGELLDWGSIPLARAHRLTIALEDASGKNDLDGILVAGRGEQPLAPQPVSPDGIAEFQGVSAGLYELTIDQPDGTSTSLLTQLPPGRDWRIEHRIGGPNHLTVEMLVDDSSELAELSAIDVTYQSARGYRVRRTVGPIRQRTLSVEGIDADSVQAEVYDHQTVTLASSGGSFSGGRLHLTLSLKGRRFSLRVVDPRGEPLSDVLVTLTDPEHPESFLTGSTNEGGECRLVGVAEGEVLVDLRHARGSHFGIPVDGSRDDAELVLDASAEVRLAFRDGDEPLRGVTCSIVDRAGSPLQVGTETDAAGQATFPRLGRALYRVRASRSDCWPVEVSAEARMSGEPARVQMRRLGDLELQVVTPEGLPVSSLPVEVVSLEFEVSVAQWLSAARVEGQGMVTDAQGCIRLARLPRGAYRWRIAFPGEEPVEGALEISHGSNPRIRLVLPR